MKEGPYKDAFVKIDKDWGEVETWTTIKRLSGRYTDGYFLAAASIASAAPKAGSTAKSQEQSIYHLPLRAHADPVADHHLLVPGLDLGYPIAWICSPTCR